MLKPLNGALITAEQFERFNILYNAWRKRPGAPPVPAEGRDVTDRWLVGLLEPHLECGERVVRIALADTLNIVEDRLRSGQIESRRGSFVSYFTTAFRGKVQETASAEVQQAASVEVAKIEVQTAAAIGEKRVQAFAGAVAQGAKAREARLINGSAKPAAVAGSSRYVIGEDGRQRFNPDAKLRVIAFHQLTGIDGNRILREVEGASIEDVEDVLIETSDVVEKRKILSRDGNTQISVKSVIDTAVNLLRKRVLYRKFGKPEDQYRGKPANPGDGWPLESEWAAITEERLREWLAKYPKALPDENYLRAETLNRIWLSLKSLWNDWSKYGQGLQAELEEKFEAELTKLHEENVERKRRAEQAYQERLAWERDFLENLAGKGGPEWERMSQAERDEAVERMRRQQEKQLGSYWSYRIRSKLEGEGVANVH